MKSFPQLQLNVISISSSTDNDFEGEMGTTNTFWTILRGKSAYFVQFLSTWDVKPQSQRQQRRRAHLSFYAQGAKSGEAGSGSNFWMACKMFSK